MGTDWQWNGSGWEFAGGDSDVPRPRDAVTPAMLGGESYIGWRNIGSALYDNFYYTHWRDAFTPESLADYDHLWGNRHVGVPTGPGPVAVFEGAEFGQDIYLAGGVVWQSGDAGIAQHNIPSLIAAEGQYRAGMEGLGQLARVEAEVVTLPVALEFRIGQLFIAGGALIGGGREVVSGLEQGNLNAGNVIDSTLGGARTGLDFSPAGPSAYTRVPLLLFGGTNAALSAADDFSAGHPALGIFDATTGALAFANVPGDINPSL